MRQLDTCDFCGGTPEGVFEVVPASVAGDARRLALCADCRGTLQSVVDPLLDAADGDSAADGADADANSRDDANASRGLAETAANANRGLAETAANEGERDENQPREHAETAADRSDSDTRDGRAEGSRDGAASADGVTIDAGDAGQHADPKPEGYAQVVRLLQNRDAAMPRGELRSLATNAYGLGDAEFDAAVDAAVENGDLRETGDGLRTA